MPIAKKTYSQNWTLFIYLFVRKKCENVRTFCKKFWGIQSPKYFITEVLRTAKNKNEKRLDF